MKCLTFFLLLLMFPLSAFGANYYCGPTSAGSNDGSNWSNRLDFDAVTPTRGNTYYLAEGNYEAKTFNAVESGTSLITIKKCGTGDGTCESAAGYSVSDHDGQAIFAGPMTFSTGYYTLDGNGTHTIPSSNTNDYGFKIAYNSTTGWYGVVSIGSSGPVSNITIKYTHIYNETNSDVNNETVMVRWHPSWNHTNTKIQKCFIENGGKDGLQISASDYVLVERTYLKHLGKLTAESPDYHGQTVQAFYGASNLVFRWNIWDRCEGQALISIGSTDQSNIRFYGNVVFCPYGATCNGFNTGGGILGGAWNTGVVSGLYEYNNTFVGLDRAIMRLYSEELGENAYGYNDIYYDIDTSAGYSYFDGYGYHLTGGGETPGGGSTETEMASSSFSSYTTNNFRLTGATTAGLTLTSQGWWSGGADSFFGQLDYATDMYGRIRGGDGTWDRGAFEFLPGNHTLGSGPQFSIGTGATVTIQ